MNDTEDKLFLQERALQKIIAECEQDVTSRERECDRKISMANSQLQAAEKELDDLIASHPVRNEQRKQELQSLKAQYTHELLLAQQKIDKMLERKRKAVEEASLRLDTVQEDILGIERQMDEVRSKLIMGDHKSD
jgi:hypothetical protein